MKNVLGFELFFYVPTHYRAIRKKKPLTHFNSYKYLPSTIKTLRSASRMH